jgi:hypothetical protein
MTDHQFKIIIAYLRVIVAILGIIAGMVIAFALGSVSV